MDRVLVPTPVRVLAEIEIAGMARDAARAAHKLRMVQADRVLKVRRIAAKRIEGRDRRVRKEAVRKLVPLDAMKVPAEPPRQVRAPATVPKVIDVPKVIADLKVIVALKVIDVLKVIVDPTKLDGRTASAAMIEIEVRAIETN